MIPKVIHYCWFGRNKLPKSAIKCINSWRKFLPDYEIKEWNEDNFDINITQYTIDAYEAKKYAFVSDYARIWILYHFGGIYFDTDVELIRPLNTILSNGPFMACEINGGHNSHIAVNPGLGLASEPKNDIYAQILEKYHKLNFWTDEHKINQYAIVKITTDVLSRNGLKNSSYIQHVGDISIYPSEYFNPMNSLTGRCNVTENTVSIHYYTNSWSSTLSKFKNFVGKIIRRLITKH